MLYELGISDSHEAAKGGLDLIVDACRDDGRIRVAPKSPLYPCYTAEAARVLCRFGLQETDASKRVVSYLVESTHASGGWRCNFTKFGKGPETVCANPGATLYVLDVLRSFPTYRLGHEVIDLAVEFLLSHWETRKPIGPCHWGIGKRFMEIEFPFLRYNLFFYVYVLSFFEKARIDGRFRAALEALQSKLDVDEHVVIEKSHRGLSGLEFCAKGRPSQLATMRFREILKNMALDG